MCFQFGIYYQIYGQTKLLRIYHELWKPKVGGNRPGKTGLKRVPKYPATKKIEIY